MLERLTTRRICILHFAFRVAVLESVTFNSNKLVGERFGYERFVAYSTC